VVADIRRVLIADADATLRQQLFSALLDIEIFSDCVANAGDALAKLTSESYGVVVVDVGLAGEIDALIGRIAAMPALTRPVVLVLAAHPEAARSLDVDIVQIVLRRPIRLSHLVDLIRSCAAQSGDRRTAEPPPPRDHASS